LPFALAGEAIELPGQFFEGVGHGTSLQAGQVMRLWLEAN
jgi:hypothetical protein